MFSVDWNFDRMLCGTTAGSITFWTVPRDTSEHPRCLADFHGHKKQIAGLFVDIPNRKVLSTSWDGTVRWWDVPGTSGHHAHCVSTTDHDPQICWDMDWTGLRAVGVSTRALSLWNFEKMETTPDQPQVLFTHEEAITCVALTRFDV